MFIKNLFYIFKIFWGLIWWILLDFFTSPFIKKILVLSWGEVYFQNLSELPATVQEYVKESEKTEVGYNGKKDEKLFSTHI